MVGESLGHYRVLELLGEGGMGAVYRAHDTQLDRDVAIKLLPEAWADDRSRLERFRREAKLLATLNHPNVATIHGWEEFEDRHCIVLELVDGETLAARLASTDALPVEEVLEIALQVARGLEAAHRRGIVHRDLKPANVARAPDGQVKILDFGLGKTLGAANPDAGLTDSPTADGDITHGGEMLGTVPYMSPEQARGEPVDRRADIWAFGCLLHECLAGKSPFLGETRSETLARILKEEPDRNALPHPLPRRLSLLLDRCLRKDPRHRLHDIADARIEIEDLMAGPVDQETPETTVVTDRSSRLPGPALALAGAALGAALAFFSVWTLSGERPVSIERIPMALPDQLQPSMGFGPSVAISPDGRTLAYVLERGTTTMLHAKRVENLEVQPVTGTEGARTPFFSPGGEWIAFFDEDDLELKKVAISGGEPVTIADAEVPWGGAWTPDDTIVFASTSSGLLRVSASGGEAPSPITDSGAGQHAWPTLLPGGDAVLLTANPEQGNFDEASIAWLPLSGGTPEVILESAYYPHYSPTGHLIFVQDGAVRAAPFDLDSRRITGTSVTLLEDVWTSSWIGYADFAFSSDGTLIYISGGPDPTLATLVEVDRSGNPRTILGERRTYRVPRFSPDRQRIAFTIADERVDVWTYDMSSQRTDRVTDSESWDAFPVWRPGTTEISFASMRAGVAEIFTENERAGAPEMLVSSEHPVYPGSWSSDGSLLAYWEEDPETGRDIWVYSAETGQSEPFLQTEYNESSPEFSPGNDLIAYHSNETGEQLEVYVRPYPEGTPRVRVSIDGGRTPRWGAEGEELFFVVAGRLMAADVSTEPELAAGPPQELFAGPYGYGYDVAADGRSFLMIQEMAEGDAPLRVNYVTGWFDEVRNVSSTGR